MSIRNHRNPFVRKPVKRERKYTHAKRHMTTGNRAALVNELRSLVRTTEES